jgi:hypothetical protein
MGGGDVEKFRAARLILALKRLKAIGLGRDITIEPTALNAGHVEPEGQRTQGPEADKSPMSPNQGSEVRPRGASFGVNALYEKGDRYGGPDVSRNCRRASPQARRISRCFSLPAALTSRPGKYRPDWGLRCLTPFASRCIQKALPPAASHNSA